MNDATPQMTLFNDTPTGDGHAADAKPVRSSRPEQVSDFGDAAEARPGYQHVKRVGWIPEAWEVTTISEIGEVVTGSTPSTKENAFYGGDYLFVGPGDLGKHRDINSSERTLTEEGFAEGRPVPEGSVLFTCISFAIGKTGLAARKLTTNQQINSVVPRNRRDSEYLYYYLNFMADRIKLLAGLQATPILNKTEFSKVKVALPSADERCQIAAILATWDRALAQLGALVAAKERRLRGLMQRLLTGEVRFPEFEGEPWCEVEMRQLGRVVTGGTPSTSDEACWGGSAAWCTPTDITALDGKIISRTKRCLTEEGVSSSAAEVLPPNSVIVCTRATIGDCAINAVPMATNQGFKSIVPDEKAGADFLYYWFCHFKHKLKRVGSGSTFLEVSKKDFGRLSVELPPPAEQRKIAATLSAAEAEVEALRRQRKALRRQKKGVMQRLLTGAVRVPAAQEAASAKDLSGLEDLNRSGGRRAGGEEA